MAHYRRLLIPVILTMVVINVGLMVVIYRYGQLQTRPARIPALSTPFPVAQTTSIPAQCREDIARYMEQSNQRINTYYEFYEAIPTTASNTQLATQLKALSKDVPVLPTGCPDDIAALLNANYLSVYASAPIHLYRIIDKSRDGVVENPDTHMALRLFQHELDIAETTTWRLQKALLK
ncbi:MAG: hypothetical protein NT020_07240 [Chloroflexales bacterium]|nr:hypothetical protein [Chloroflexales bacterium]